jgi:iron complex outermembrane recepter protein
MKSHSISRRSELSIAAAALIGCVLIASLAHAQTVQPSGRTAALQQPVASSQGSPTELTEIVVMAQRREENIREVPLSITVVSSADLERAGTTNNLELTQLVPGLKMDRVAGFTNPSIRGVTTLINVPGADPNVATYIDGIYQANPAAGTLDLPDVQRIEVDKGPQGSLFGRNATGGAIQIFTRDPTDNLAGHVEAGYASFNDQSVKGYLAGPIVEGKVFGSISAYDETADSYYKNIGPPLKLNGIKNDLLRAKLIIKATDKLTLSFAGFAGQHSNANGNLGNPFNGITQAVRTPGAIFSATPYQVASNVAPKSLVIVKGGSGKAEYDSGIGVLTLTTSYNYTNARLVLPTFGAYLPAGGQYFYQNSPNQTYQTELNLVSRKYGAFSYIAGLAYYQDSQTFDPLNVTTNGAQSVSIYAKQTSLAESLFGEATYEFTDNLSAIVGARYTDETRELFGHTYLGGAYFATPPPDLWAPIASKSFHGFTPRLSLRDKLNANTSIYLTYSEGFKSGLFNAAAVPVPPSTKPPEVVDPEKLRAFEIGIKSQPHSWFSYNAAMFMYNYSNQQVASGQIVNGVSLSTTQNAGKSKIYGAEFEANMRPVPEFSLSAGISLLHARIDSFPLAQISVPVAPDNFGTAVVLRDVSGNTLPRSPSWTANLAGTYTKKYDVGTLSYSANVFHTAKAYYDYGNLYSQDEYTDVGVRASLQPASMPRLTLAAYGKNLTDNAVILGLFNRVNAVTASWAPPRSFGFTISYDLE